MELVWQKRFLRIISNFSISFLTPFSGSGIGQALYVGEVNIGQMVFVAMFSSIVYSMLIVSQEIRDYASK